MDWVKLTTDYYRDLAIAVGDDAAEVMFTRGIALCGEIESGGFIPDAMLHSLTRRPAHAPRTAKHLVDAAKVWDRVPGGYQVVNWHIIQAELEKLVEKKRRDRDRKRTERASVGQSNAVSVDSPATRPGDRLYESESKTKNETAAAAAVGAAATALPASIDILRSKMQAHTSLQALRFDTLDDAKTQILEDLIAKHGDHVLVDVAVRTLRTPPPTAVTAFLGTWQALPEPGERLRVVEAKCETRGHQDEIARKCRLCAADALAGDA